MKGIKSLFATPVKTIVTILCILVILAVAGASSVFAVSRIAESKSIGKSNAEKIALSDANIDSSSAFISRTDFDYDHDYNCFCYEVEFASDGDEYDYTIKADDGSIITRDADIRQLSATSTRQSNAQTAVSESAASGSNLSDSIASPASGSNASDPASSSVSVNSSDVKSAGGSLDSVSAASVPGSSANVTATNCIGIDAAKNAVLKDSSLSADSVTFIKAKADYENGRDVYEIEFNHNNMEHDYVIDAYNGTVISHETEHQYSVEHDYDEHSYDTHSYDDHSYDGYRYDDHSYDDYRYNDHNSTGGTVTHH